MAFTDHARKKGLQGIEVGKKVGVDAALNIFDWKI
jgi:hypothetical protein